MRLPFAAGVGGCFDLDIAESFLDAAAVLAGILDAVRPIDGGYVSVDSMHDGGDENDCQYRS